MPPNTFGPWSGFGLTRERCFHNHIIRVLYSGWVSWKRPDDRSKPFALSVCWSSFSTSVLGLQRQASPSHITAWIVSPSADTGLWWSVCCDWDPRVGLEGLNMGKEDETEAGKRGVFLARDVLSAVSTVCKMELACFWVVCNFCGNWAEENKNRSCISCQTRTHWKYKQNPKKQQKKKSKYVICRQMEHEYRLRNWLNYRIINHFIYLFLWAQSLKVHLLWTIKSSYFGFKRSHLDIAW